MWDDLKEFFEWGKGLAALLLLLGAVVLVCILTLTGWEKMEDMASRPHTTQYIRCGEMEFVGVSNIGIEGEAITFTKDGKAYAMRAAGLCEWGEMSVPVEEQP